MGKKLTLTLDGKAVETAKDYAKKNKVSLSKLVEFYFKALSYGHNNYDESIPPITRELSGIAKITAVKSDKELLENALNRRFL